MRRTRSATVIAVLAAAAFGRAPAEADVRRPEDLVLVDGRYLQVKVLEGDAVGVRVMVLETGGTVFIPWDRILERDRLRIMKNTGVFREARQVESEAGVRLVMKTGDVLLGRLVKETPEELTIRRRGADETYKRALITEIAQEAVPATEIEKERTLYEAKLKEIAPTDDDVAGQLEMAEYAEVLDLYEEAVGHYLKVRAADPEYEAVRVKNTLARLEELSKAKAFREALDQSRRLTNALQFKKSFALLDELDKIPDAPSVVKSEITAIRSWVTSKRYEHFRVLVRDRYLATTKNFIAAMSRDEKLKLAEAQQRLRSKLHKEVVAKLAVDLDLDPKEDVEVMWKDRRMSSRTASYGSGTFIVLGMAQNAQKQQAELQRALMQDLARRNQQGRGNNQGGSVSAEPEKLPKPPTKEEWWTRSTAGDREAWMFCYWVETSKQVEIVGESWEQCSRCGATGSLAFSGSQGETLKVTCPMCQGHQKHKGYRFK